MAERMRTATLAVTRPGNPENLDKGTVGAALAAHGHIRATKDMDLWIRPIPANAVRVIAALREFAAPLGDLHPGDLSVPGVEVGVLSREDLLKNKKARGRLQDLADIEALSKLAPEKE